MGYTSPAMATALEMVEEATGSSKFIVLAAALDQMAEQVRSVSVSKSVDDEIAILYVEDLASTHGVGFEAMRRQLCGVLGRDAVHRLGKRWVIRKRRFLEYLTIQECRSTLGVDG